MAIAVDNLSDDDDEEEEGKDDKTKNNLDDENNMQQIENQDSTAKDEKLANGSVGEGGNSATAMIG